MKRKMAEEKDDWDKILKSIRLTFCASILVFACIYLFDITDFPSKIGIVNQENSKSWLQYSIDFFGPVAAAFIGFIGGIMSVFITIKKQGEYKKEESRKNVLPLVKVKDRVKRIPPINISGDDIKGFSDNFAFPIIDLARDEEAFLIINLEFENVGQREMYDVWVGGVESSLRTSKNYHKIASILYKGDKYKNYLSSAVSCPNGEKTIDISFKIYYKDCYDNWYFQRINGKGSFASNSYLIDNFIVDSATVLIRKDVLPNKIKR